MRYTYVHPLESLHPLLRVSSSILTPEYMVEMFSIISHFFPDLFIFTGPPKTLPRILYIPFVRNKLFQTIRRLSTRSEGPCPLSL